MEGRTVVLLQHIGGQNNCVVVALWRVELLCCCSTVEGRAVVLLWHCGG